MPALFSLVAAGFRRYRKKRKNLTVVLSAVFFLMFLFMNFFHVLGGNLDSYWIGALNGGDVAVLGRESRVDMMTPVDPGKFFMAADFLEHNRGLENLASPRLRFGAMLGPQKGTEELEQQLVLIGIHEDAEKKLLPGISIKEGNGFSGRENEIILPQAIAGNLGVQVGEDVVVAAKTVGGFYTMEKATLVGLQDVPATSFIFGIYSGYVPMALARRLLDTQLSSEMVLKPGYAHSVKGEFRLSPALFTMSVSRAMSMAYLFLQWIVILFLGVFCSGIVYQNIVLLNEERVAEIGIYLSYGASPAWIQSLMYAELAVYALYCAMIGTVAGAAVMGGLTTLGMSPVDMVTDVMMGGKELNLWPGPGVWLACTALLLAFVLAAASIPVLKATRSTAIVGLFRKQS